MKVYSEESTMEIQQVQKPYHSISGMCKDHNRGMCRWSGIGEEVVDEVTDVIGGQIYRALKATIRTLAFSNIYIRSHQSAFIFLTFSIMNYNTLQKNSKTKMYISITSQSINTYRIITQAKNYPYSKVPQQCSS